MLNKSAHLFLKFQNKNIYVDGTWSTTVEEHKKVLKNKGKLVWGQGTEKKNISGLGKDKRKIIENQLNSEIPTYVFFTCHNNGKRDLFVGRYINSYNRGGLKHDSPQVKYIPSYYSEEVGTEKDDAVVFVEVDSMVKIDEKYIDDIFLYSNKSKNILGFKNSSSLFYVCLTDNLLKVIDDTFSNVKTRRRAIIDENDFQEDVENCEVDENITVDDKPKQRVKRNKASRTTENARDAATAKRAIVLAKYKCEADNNHQSFISAKSKKNYVEAHHLIPMEYQDEFEETSIDVEANIVSLCPNCHKKLHHATFEEKKEMLAKLFDERKVRLEKCNIKIDLERLYGFYR